MLDNTSKAKTDKEKINSSQKHKKQLKNLLDELTQEKLKDLLNNPQFIEYLNLNQKGTSDLVNMLKQKSAKQLTEQKNSSENNNNEEDRDVNENKLANQNISDMEVRYLK